MAIPVKLPVFEGPLDLLMHLIEKNKIDIYDIPIAEITDQYLEYVRRMDHEDMDVTSEFLVMAATLLDIKSRMLLPREKDEETGEEEGDPREELVQRLLEYKKYKYLSEELAVRREQAGVRFFRTQNLPKEVLHYQPPIDYGELLGGVDLNRLQTVFGEVLRRKKSRRDPIRSGFGKIKREEVSIDSKALYIRAWLRSHPRTDFRDLLERQKSREEVIVTFLILLELMKTQKIRILQDSIGGKILIETAETGDPNAEEKGRTGEEDAGAEILLEDSKAEAAASESPAGDAKTEDPMAEGPAETAEGFPAKIMEVEETSEETAAEPAPEAPASPSAAPVSGSIALAAHGRTEITSSPQIVPQDLPIRAQEENPEDRFTAEIVEQIRASAEAEIEMEMEPDIDEDEDTAAKAAAEAELKTETEAETENTEPEDRTGEEASPAIDAPAEDAPAEDAIPAEAVAPETVMPSIQGKDPGKDPAEKSPAEDEKEGPGEGSRSPHFSEHLWHGTMPVYGRSGSRWMYGSCCADGQKHYGVLPCPCAWERARLARLWARKLYR